MDEKERLLGVMVELLKQMRSVKPDERSEDARRMAVAITDMEKVAAYWAQYVAGGQL